jgi:hypothetical protein
MNQQPRPMSAGGHPNDPTGEFYGSSNARFDRSRAAFDSAIALFDLTNLLAETSFQPAPSEAYRPRAFPVRATTV